MILEGIHTIWLQEVDHLLSLYIGKARAHSDVLQVVAVVKTKQQRANAVFLSLLMPAKTGNDAITVALVLDFQHHPLVRLVGSGFRLGDNTV